MSNHRFRGSVLRELRKSKGWSQEDLLVELGKEGVRLSRQRISQIENNVHAPPRADELMTMADVLGATVEDFFSGTEAS